MDLTGRGAFPNGLSPLLKAYGFPEIMRGSILAKVSATLQSCVSDYHKCRMQDQAHLETQQGITRALKVGVKRPRDVPDVDRGSVDPG